MNTTSKMLTAALVVWILATFTALESLRQKEKLLTILQRNYTDAVDDRDFYHDQVRRYQVIIELQAEMYKDCKVTPSSISYVQTQLESL